MKLFLYLIAIVWTIAALNGSCSEDDKREEKPRFKGVELYSWKDREGNWVFVLLDGTNELKTKERIKGAKNQTKGIQDLKKALARLAVGEQVFWTDRIEGLEFPPEKTQMDIKKAAEEAKIVLRSSEYKE